MKLFFVLETRIKLFSTENNVDVRDTLNILNSIYDDLGLKTEKALETKKRFLGNMF